MKTHIIIISFFTLLQFVSSQPEYLHQGNTLCLASDIVPNNSVYYANVLFVLSNLTALSSVSLFSNVSSGSGTDQVNGLYLCRPDLPLKSCHTCVVDALAKRLLINCTARKQAISFYEECMVRYSNRTIFSTVEMSVNLNTTCGWLKVSQQDIFPALLNDTMQGLITKAVLSPEGGVAPFAYGHVNFTVFEGLYGMVLCTPDITRGECRDCLETALGLVPSCEDGLSQFTLVYLPSCQLRYDTAPFMFPSWP